MATTLMDIISNLTNCLFCFPSSPNLKINARTLRLLRLLGEGGFSYVYLVQDTTTSALYALKKIRCPFGQESVALALKEVEAYSLFSGVAGGDYIIHSIDHQVKDEGGRVSGIGNSGEAGAQKTVYILLPYYRRGNLQDEINANLVNRTRFSERRLMKIMLGVCKGLKAMHHYKIPGGGPAGAARRDAQNVRDQAAEEDADMRRQAKGKGRQMTASAQRNADEEGEAEQPLMPDNAGGEITASQAKKRPGEAHAYAHRDIKPANIMLDDDDPSTNGSSEPKPILMDLGSIAPSPTPITSRSQALAVQDTAAEHSTMPYRAPELFDVKTGSAIDTKVDIWSLGCTMYACLIGKSPFEARSDETGGSLSICVLGGDWKWPDENAPKPKRQGTIVEGDAQTNGNTPGGDSVRKYPCEEVRDVVKRCLMVEPSERPDVDELMGLIQNAVKHIPDGGDGDGSY